jgi:hypothetical protein
MTGRAPREAGIMRGVRYLVVLVGAGVLAAACGTKMAAGVDLAAAEPGPAGV